MQACSHGRRGVAFAIVLASWFIPRAAQAQIDNILGNVLRGVQQYMPPSAPYPSPAVPHYVPAPSGYASPGYPPAAPPAMQGVVRPAPGSASPSRPALVEMQQMLNQLSYGAGPPNGVWGEQSARALRAFQRDHGQVQDGIVSAISRAAVQSVWYVQTHPAEHAAQPAGDADASGPSFNCGAASSQAERQICSSPELAALDRTLAQAFTRARAAAQPDTAVLAGQRNWLGRRDGCKGDVRCIRSSMQQRLAELANGPPLAAAAIAAAPAPVFVPPKATETIAAVAQQRASRSLVGEWEGKYSCGTIVNNGFDLNVTHDADGALAGVFRFDVPNKPGQSGRFKLLGNPAGSDGQFMLAPSEWIDRVPGMTAVGMTGQVTANNLSAAGMLLGCGMSSFDAHRRDAVAAIHTAAPPVAPPEPGGPFEGIWRGDITCGNGRGSFTVPINIAVSHQGPALAATVTAAVPDLRGGAPTQVQGVFLSSAADGGSPLSTAIMLSRQLQPKFPHRIVLDAETGTIRAEMYGPGCATAVTRVGPRLPPLAVPAGSSLVGAWATPAPDALRGNPQFSRSVAMLSTSTQLEFRLMDGQLYGQIRAASPLEKPPTEQDRLVADLRPLLVTEDGRIGFVITRRTVAEGAFDPAAAPQYANAFTHGALLLVEPPAAPQADLQVALASDRWLYTEPNMLLQRQSAEAAQAIASGGPAQPVPAGLGGRIAGARSLQEQCEVLAAWGRPVAGRSDAMSRPVDQLQREALPLFENDAFVPVFGRPYIMLSAEQRKPIYFLLARDCPQRLKLQGTDHYDISTPWSPQPEGSFSFAAVTTKMLERHDALSGVFDAIDRVRKLPETAGGLVELNQIARTTVPLNELLSEVEREPFPHAVAENRTRIQNGIMRTRIAAIGELPQLAASIGALKTLLADMARSELPAPEQAQAAQAISVRAQAIVQPTIAAGAEQVGQAPRTLAGLAEATRIARSIGSLTSELDDRLGRSAAVAAAEPIARQRRDIMADPAVSQAFQQAAIGAAASGNSADIAGVANKYLQPGEASTAPEYRRALELASNRVGEEQHKAAMAQNSANADANAAASAGLGGAASDTGEPTGREMEAAVSSIASGLSAGQDNLAGRCQRREFRDDPGLALMCLAQIGAGGPMHVGVTNFRKLACSKAQGQPGYICDYSFGLDLASGRNMGVLGDMMRSGGNCTGRFVRTASQGWLLQEKDCR